VFISSFSFRWLKRSFAHCCISLKSCNILFWLVLSKPSANIQTFFFPTRTFLKIFLIHFITFVPHKNKRHVSQIYQINYSGFIGCHRDLAIYRK